MGTELWWIFDALIVMLFVYVLYSNGKRGVTKVFIINIGYILATVLGGLVAVAVAPQLYDSGISASNVSAVRSVNSKISCPKIFVGVIDEQRYGFVCDLRRVAEYLEPPETAQYVEKLYHYVNHKYGEEVCPEDEFRAMLEKAFAASYRTQLGEKLPEYVRMNFDKAIAGHPEQIGELIVILYDHDGKAAEKIEEKYVREPTIEVLGLFSYIVVFAIVMIIALIISALILSNDPLIFNVGRSSERLFGALFGLAEAFAFLVMFTVIVRLMVMLGGGETLIFNDETIAETKIFHLLYDHLSALI